MQISHEEARKLIQLQSDQSLIPQEKNKLVAHLGDCVECRAYAEQIEEIESILLPAMKRRWSVQPAPLSVNTLARRANSSWQASIVLVTRTALMSLVFVAFVLGAWQFTRSSNRTSTPMPSTVLPIPTPSGQSTSTKIGLSTCKEFLYQLQESDTLESIADHFSVSKDKIIEINHLNTEGVQFKAELWIPLCNSTPTGTIYPSTLTLTFTPLLGPITSTPGG